MLRNIYILGFFLMGTALSTGAAHAQNDVITRDKLDSYYKEYANVLVKNRGIEPFLDKFISDSYQLVSQDVVKLPDQEDRKSVNEAGKALLISSTLEAQESIDWKTITPRLQNVVIAQGGQSARVVNLMTGTADVELKHPQTGQKANLIMIIKSVCADDFTLEASQMKVLSSKCETETIFRF